MNLSKIIQDTEKLGCSIVFLNDYTEKGRYITINDEHFIFINSRLSKIEKVNVILHERKHFKEKDTQNSLNQIKTYNHRIERIAEESRIINFLSLINSEYPIDESFNYHQYMKYALIPYTYENIVKDTAKKLYKKNIKNKSI